MMCKKLLFSSLFISKRLCYFSVNEIIDLGKKIGIDKKIMKDQNYIYEVMAYIYNGF